MSLRHTIHNDILEGKYECVICFNTIDTKSSIWNCSSCYRAFDLKCIRDWSRRNLVTKKSWTCPFCQATQGYATPESIKYSCWCGKCQPKKFKPLKVTPEQIPHSCGKKCNTKRSCPHPCPLTCHAGPHEDVKLCRAPGPRVSCFCKREHETKPCNETRYGGYSCGRVCEKIDSICGHSCSRLCHFQKRKPIKKGRGSTYTCGPCKELVVVNCHCGNLHNQVKKCSSLSTSERKQLKRRGNGSSETLIVSCQKKCRHTLSCGKHNCDKICHESTENVHKCPYLPYENETCYCGSRFANRSSCEDPIPSCGNVCFKELGCGHRCRKTCHSGACPPCIEPIHNLTCRCKQSQVTATCAKVSSGCITCTKKCGALLSCHRHRCTKECCEFSTKQKPKSSSRKNANNSVSLSDLLSGVNLERRAADPEEQAAIEAEEAAHFCTEVCGRVLSCGAHYCERNCHSGKCPPCPEVSFDQWSCSCGKTIIEPPIRCGTLMPTCRYTCMRARPCGHETGHLCHEDDVDCPRCRHTLTFPCKCGKSTLKIPCCDLDSAHLKVANFNCLAVCGKQLPCGHQCQQKCCDRKKGCPPCTSVCDTKNQKCGHAHDSLCHFPTECPHECSKQLTASCSCTVLKCTYECGEDMEIGCNEKCVDEHYSSSLLDAYEEDKVWMLNLETQIRSFVRSGEKKALHFKPMGLKNRKRVHELAEHYRLESQSLDEGANRSVCLYLTKNRWIPQYTLKNAPRKDPIIEIDQAALRAPLQYAKYRPDTQKIDENMTVQSDAPPLSVDESTSEKNNFKSNLSSEFEVVVEVPQESMD